jgi:hypothetical protein
MEAVPEATSPTILTIRWCDESTMKVKLLSVSMASAAPLNTDIDVDENAHV